MLSQQNKFLGKHPWLLYYYNSVVVGFFISVNTSHRVSRKPEYSSYNKHDEHKKSKRTVKPDAVQKHIFIR